MSLKSLTDVQRISFIKEFTFQLMANSIKDEELRRIIEIEKLRRKYIGQESSPQEFSRIFDPEFEKFSRQPIIKLSAQQPEQYQKSFFPVKTPISLSTNPIIKPILHPKPKFLARLQQKTKQQPTQQFFQTQPQTLQIQQQVTESNVLKKLDFLIKDLAVQMIECPGSGKNLLVKVRNKINLTRITLNEPEIRSVIDYFSKSAMIPVSDGILNAAVGSLLISAVVSEHAGSRFIITKKSPYELLEGVNY